MKDNRRLAALAALVGLALIVVAIVYWVEPARSLPAFLVGLALLLYAWFQTAPSKRAA